MMRIALLIGLGVALSLGVLSIFLFPATPFPINSQPEAIRTSNVHIWISANSSSSVSALVVESVGSKTTSIERILINGQEVPIASWYYNNDPDIAHAVNIRRVLPYDQTLESIEVSGSGPPEKFVRATAPISLKPGQAMFLYLANPPGIAHTDSGNSVALKVEASEAHSVQSVLVKNT